MRLILTALSLALFGVVRLPLENSLAHDRQQLRLETAPLQLGAREQVGQLGFVAALSGFRAIVADFLFIAANSAWERTDWERLLLYFRAATTLQPHNLLFWDMGAWHLGWNASLAALRDPAQPRQALRVKAQREYLDLARDFLERGIRNNPHAPQLPEALARLYRDQFHDHARASAWFAQAATLPGAAPTDRRFSAYELSYCPGREHEAYEQLRNLYLEGESQRLPALLARLNIIENKLGLPADQRLTSPSADQP